MNEQWQKLSCSLSPTIFIIHNSDRATQNIPKPGKVGEKKERENDINKDNNESTLCFDKINKCVCVCVCVRDK